MAVDRRVTIGISQVMGLGAALAGKLDASAGGGGGGGGGGSTEVTEYDFSTTMTAPPGSGEVRFNGAHPYTGVTMVWIHTITSDDTDVRIGLAAQPSGATLYVQDRDESTSYAKFRTTGEGTDHGTYFAFPVTWVANGAAISNNENIGLQFAGGGTAGAAAHAATHETGGADAIDSLDASVLTSGTIDAARLPAVVAAYWEPLSTGAIPDPPEVIFAGGDALQVNVP